MIEVHGELDDIESIYINGKALEWDDDEAWLLPKGLIGDSLVNQLPEAAVFSICHIDDPFVVFDTIPIKVQRIGDNRVRLEFKDSNTREDWDGTIDLKTYMETMKSIVEEANDITLTEYEDDGEWIYLSYSTEATVEKVSTAVELAEQIVAEIEGATEMRLGVELWAPNEEKREKEFTLNTVLPILRKIGFKNVKYTHGNKEFGRDVTFTRNTEFNDVEFWAAQVKFGDVAGAANAEIDDLLAQIDDAFKVSYNDLYTKQRQRIAKLAIIISGKFTENAIEKICEKIEDNAIRNNLVFVDGDKVATLAEQFRRIV